MNPEYIAGLFGVSLVISGIALVCDFKWRKYPNWAYYTSLILVGFFWYLFMRQEGWLANPQANALNIAKVVVGLFFICGIGAVIGTVLHGSKFGVGDAKFMVVLSLLVPTTYLWLGTETIYPQTHQYIPIDFWANTILFWGVFTLILTLFTTLIWEPEGPYTVPLAPVIVAAFYFTIWYGGIWRGVVEPIIPIILGG